MQSKCKNQNSSLATFSPSARILEEARVAREARAETQKAREDIYKNEVLLLSLFDLKNLLYIHNNCFFLFLFSLLPQSKFE
jgi:hypothetical protein